MPPRPPLAHVSGYYGPLQTSALSQPRIRVAVAGVERSEPPVVWFRGLTSFDPGHPSVASTLDLRVSTPFRERPTSREPLHSTPTLRPDKALESSRDKALGTLRPTSKFALRITIRWLGISESSNGGLEATCTPRTISYASDCA